VLGPSLLDNEKAQTTLFARERINY